MTARALIALALLAAPAAAHEDFPPEWCGGEDCRFATPGEVAIEGEVYLVRLGGAEVRVPLSAAPLWEGCRIALCVHRDGDRLNRCNPSKGPCPAETSAFGLLIPAWHVFPELGEDCAEAEAGAAITLAHAGLAGPRALSPAPRGGFGSQGARAGGGSAAPEVPAVSLPPALGLFGAALAALFLVGIRRHA